MGIIIGIGHGRISRGIKALVSLLWANTEGSQMLWDSGESIDWGNSLIKNK